MLWATGRASRPQSLKSTPSTWESTTSSPNPQPLRFNNRSHSAWSSVLNTDGPPRLRVLKPATRNLSPMTSSRPMGSTTRSTASPPALQRLTRREQASSNGSSLRPIIQPKRTHGTRFAARVTIGTSRLSARGALAWTQNALNVPLTGWSAVVEGSQLKKSMNSRSRESRSC